MRIGSLFAGIGGLELGLEMSGLGHTVWQVERDPFCQTVLAKHWPEAARINDVKTAAANLTPVDVICGGFPCQDVSSAGKGAGLAGSRSGLWFEFARIVGEVRPSWVVVENVASGAKRWVDQVVYDLECLDYETLPIPLSAQDVGAPHLRKRIFVIGYSDSDGQSTLAVDAGTSGLPCDSGYASDPNGCGCHGGARPRGELPGWKKSPDGGWRCPVPAVHRVDDGLPDRLDRNRALGNAVVPKCAEVIGYVIQELARRA